MSELVFVYGTLKRTHGNHVVLLRSGSDFLGEATTKPEYTMYDNGAFPAITKGGNTVIFGEVYKVDHMSYLDGLEGYPVFYNRELIDTPYGKAWIYFLPATELANYWKPVDSGIWR